MGVGVHHVEEGDIDLGVEEGVVGLAREERRDLEMIREEDQQVAEEDDTSLIPQLEAAVAGFHFQDDEVEEPIEGYESLLGEEEEVVVRHACMGIQDRV